MYKTGFEKVIEMYKDNTFIDATEGGAYIKGTKICKLSTVIENYCNSDFDINQYINRAERLIK